MQLLAKLLRKVPGVSHFLNALFLNWELPKKHHESKFRGVILDLSSSPDVSDSKKKILKEYLWHSRLEYFNKCKSN
jgi:hypothetical protein